MNMKLNNRDFTHIEMLLALAILSLIVAIGMSVYDGSYSFFSSIRRHTRSLCDWSSDVCSSDLRRVQRHADHRMRHHIGGFAGMRFDELMGQDFFSGQKFEPPRAVPFGAGFHAMNQIAFADDSDKGILIIDHRHGADAI